MRTLITVLLLLAAASRIFAEEVEEKVVTFPGIKVYVTEKKMEVQGKIAINKGILDFFAVARDGKDYESVLVLFCKPSHFQAGLILLGLKKGEWLKPKTNVDGPRKWEINQGHGDFVDMKVSWKVAEGIKTRLDFYRERLKDVSRDLKLYKDSMKMDLKPQMRKNYEKRINELSKTAKTLDKKIARMKILLGTTNENERVELDACQLIINRETGKPLENSPWVFTGSRFFKDKEGNEIFAADTDRSIIAVWYDHICILNLAKRTKNPYEGEDTGLEINTTVAPGKNTPVILTVIPQKKKEPSTDDK